MDQIGKAGPCLTRPREAHEKLPHDSLCPREVAPRQLLTRLPICHFPGKLTGCSAKTWIRLWLSLAYPAYVEMCRITRVPWWSCSPAVSTQLLAIINTVIIPGRAASMKATEAGLMTLGFCVVSNRNPCLEKVKINSKLKETIC